DFELYNLKNDLAQEKDVIANNRKQFETMKAQMVKIHKDIVTEGKNWDIPPEHGAKRFRYE
ncbi:MAG: hypothetical protein KJT03_12195, partial [Verrucomicrobiae bacterium]|nr:hypothetical protein [Verrucomicrobiae bacterium]